MLNKTFAAFFLINPGNNFTLHSKLIIYTNINFRTLTICAFSPIIATPKADIVQKNKFQKR